ncbi:hypothetical protein ACFXS9_24660 [Bradyrhizobium sp. RDI18]
MRDESVDLPFEITWQIVVVEQDAALQGLVPTLHDLFYFTAAPIRTTMAASLSWAAKPWKSDDGIFL